MSEQAQNERTAKGQFAKGVSGNPKGRAPKARELARLAVLHEVVTMEDWREIIGTLKEQAKDGNEKAARILFEYLIGKPDQVVKIEDAREGDSVCDEFAGYSDEELRAIIAESKSSNP